MPAQAKRMPHSLVIGGSGMLRQACLALAAAGPVSVVGRDGLKLDTLAQEAPGAIHAISVDYTDSEALQRELHRAVALHGPIDRAIAWIHSTAPEALSAAAQVLNAAPCRFFHVQGSAAAAPDARMLGWATEFRSYENLSYRQVILGFVVEASGSRWLRHDEIARGVLEAVESDSERFVVGTVEPWSLRP